MLLTTKSWKNLFKEKIENSFNASFKQIDLGS